jgi:hypothetical protein
MIRAMSGFIALMLIAVRTSETSAYFYETTRRNIPEGCHQENVSEIKNEYSKFVSCVFQLCALAQSWANHLAHINTFYYNNNRDVGQNLFCRPTNSIQTDVTGNVSSTSWSSG